ncbi:MAG: diaminopimelate epimerase [Bacteroidota bacterium]
MNSISVSQFYKYQGTGNDFIMIDDRDTSFPKSDAAYIALLCDRRFGVGADGLILLQNDDLSDFKMIYYNADGNESSMCGNGGRCIVAFAKSLGIIQEQTVFSAIDGRHEARITDKEVQLKMIDVKDVKDQGKYIFLNTGSPHHVQVVKDLERMDLKREGARIRYGLYGKSGCNINFVEQQSTEAFTVRTYERGVEDETLSCGTGVTAVAIAMHHRQQTASNTICIKTHGGELQVRFRALKNGNYSDIWLIGPAKFVFQGDLPCYT